MFYAYESINYTAVGPFATQAEAQAWITRVVPPEDREEADENGFRVISGETAKDYAEEFETPEAVEARYAECYAEYYPNFKKGE
jgi:hypothetical protein